MPTGYQYVWNGDISTSFDLAGNWENLQTGTTATSVPGVDDSAAITAQGLITGTSSVYTLSITGTGTGLSIGGQIDGQFTSLLGNITVDAGDSLSADVNTSVQQGALLTVGAGAAATVTLDAGAHLLSNWNGAQGVDMVIGQSNGSGTVNASGAGALVSSGEDGIQIGAGGQGLIAHDLSKRGGRLVASFPIENTDEILLVTDQGQLIRCPTAEVRIAGRNTSGVTIFRTAENEHVVSVERLESDGQSPDDEPDGEPDAGQAD